ncbi:Ig-like domain repeat protein [Nocardioides sp. Bht2]|uniref:Ig-like domain repeat protein n=1 Tax=Nocardioides sp. Bht2 TaxID=3392297 RepID=UPI0039B60F71
MTIRPALRPPIRARAVALACAALLTASLAHVGAAEANLSPADAGAAVAWGKPDAPPPVLPSALAETPLAQALVVGTEGLFLTSAGEVMVHSGVETKQVPPELAGKKVALIAADPSFSDLAALTDDGELIFWGARSTVSNTTGVDLTNLRQLDLGARFGVGVKSDGTVVTWGENTYGQTNVPAGLTDVVKVAAGSAQVYALRANGTVVAWGRSVQNQLVLPPELTVPGSVKDIEARVAGGLALLADGTLRSWGQNTTGEPASAVNAVPASVNGLTITQIASTTSYATNLAIDSTGGIHVWGLPTQLPSAIPAGLDGRTLSHVAVGGELAVAIQRKVMTITASTVTGTAKQGSTLTGTPATFSGAPTLSYQWLANGTPISGATERTLTLGSAQVGKRISFRTIALDGSTPLNSDSTQTAAVTPLAPVKVASKTAISKVKGKKKTATFSIRVTRSGGTPTGKVAVLIKRGSKTVYKKSVTLRSGSVKVTVKRLKKGKHTISSTYAGDTRSRPSTAAKRSFRIR